VLFRSLSVAVISVSAALVVPWIWPAPPQVLVVLPFQPATGDRADRVYAEELVDAITVVLDEIDKPGELIVIAPAEVRSGNVTNAQQARKVLGATRVLEGSLQRFGNVIRVTYSLVDTRSLRQVRAGWVTADASDPLAVQTRVIEAVLTSLKIELDKADRQRMASHGTGQPQAYEAYLRGRGYLQGYDRLDDLDRAIAAFQSSVTLDPGFAAAFAGLGQAYVYKFDSTHSPESLVAARSACSRAEELNSAIPGGETCLGMVFSRTGEYEQAARHLERAVQLDDRSEESLRQLAEAYEQLQRLPEAESILKKAIALHPRYWGGHKHLGAFYVAQGRYQEAIEQFQQVVKLAPDSYSGYSNLGGVYLRQGDYAAGIAQLEKSVAIHPTAQALSNLGAAYFYQHNYPESARSYQAAAQMDPNRSAIFGNLAEAYSQIPGREQEGLRNYAEALRLAEQGLKVNPNDGASLMDAAFYAAMLGQNAKAEEYRTAGLERSPQVPVARLRSARVLAQFHRDREAMNELEQALRAGLSATEITNDPAWQRFAVYPEFAALLARAQKQ
jgi:tetratricopeptide (TPR) repeat protein/TolB-like protein